LFPHDFRWTDPHTWPGFVWVWAGFLVLGWIVPLWKWFRRDRAKSWPSASGFVESIGEPEQRRFLGLTMPQNSSQGIIEIQYSYSALGQSFRGSHKLDNSAKFNPDEFTNRLVRSPVLVQYHPEKPSISLLLDSSIEALLRQAPPPSQEEEHRLRGAREIPAIYRPWLQPLMYLALAGFLISLCINIACVLRKQMPLDAPFFLMHLGIFVVFFPAILTAQKMVGNTNRRGFWKAVMKNVPEAVSYLFYVIFAYSWLTGFYSFFNGAPANGHRSTLSSGSEWLVFSGIWMDFYYASFAIFLSARNSSFKYPKLSGNS